MLLIFFWHVYYTFNTTPLFHFYFLDIWISYINIIKINIILRYFINIIINKIILKIFEELLVLLLNYK